MNFNKQSNSNTKYNIYATLYCSYFTFKLTLTKLTLLPTTGYLHAAYPHYFYAHLSTLCVCVCWHFVTRLGGLLKRQATGATDALLGIC